MQIKPRTSGDAEVLSIWRDVYTSKAFLAGLPDSAGQVLIPTSENIQDLTKRITASANVSGSESRLKLLTSLNNYLLNLEPVHVPDYVLEAFFGHLVKQETSTIHLTSLAECSRKALSGYLQNRGKDDWPTGQRLLAVIRCKGLLELLSVIQAQTRSKALKAGINALVADVNDYEKHFRIEEFFTGTFDEVWALIREQGCALGREHIYQQALRDGYDYYETPAEVEERGLHFLRNELGQFRRLTEEFASRLGCDAYPEAVRKTLRQKRALQIEKVIPCLHQIRRLVVRIIHRRIVNINPKYNTKVLETPQYLSGVTPSGATVFLDYLTENPRQIFLATTDPRRDPHTMLGELLNLLMHEEYGHCVHVSNSAAGYAVRPEPVEMLWSSLGIAVSEGIAFHREFEFAQYLDQMTERNRLTKEERSFARLCERLGGFENVKQEYRLCTQTWRITRFLRVIGDARINSGKQELLDFIEWAHKETGLDRSIVYFQVFPAHQSSMGGATTYAILGKDVEQMQAAAREAGEDVVKFNTYASSLGFVPRTVFKSRLTEYLKT